MAILGLPSVQLRSTGIFKLLLFLSMMNLSCSDNSYENYKPSLQERGAIESYYSDAQNKTGSQLHSALTRILGSNVRKLSYDSALDAIKDIDTDPNDSVNVVLIYTGESRDKRQHLGGKNGDQWNREHVWPQSRGAQTYKSDIHNLWPSDARLNSIRGNKDFAECSKELEGVEDTYTDSKSFEPRDEFKGEVARVLFYMATRYPTLTLNDDVGNGSHSLGRLCTMLEWNEADPVSEFETKRNEGIHQRWQKNRNPFVDHPEWAREIWGSRC